jgi:uncharacterized protein DUF3810
MWKKKSAWIILVALTVCIKIFALFPSAVEQYYANGFYPVVSQALRILLGWIPLSIGDLLYGVAIIYLLVQLYRLVRKVVKRQTNRQYWWTVARKIVFGALLVYVSFNILWGLNYNRLGIAQQLGLKMDRYSKDDLVQVMQQLVYRLNALDTAAKQNRAELARKRHLFAGAVEAYDNLGKNERDFRYNFRSVKPSLYSYLGNYLGYTGYYNPFSGEAQVNTTVPLFVQPFTTCHEIGHQLGYAKENEANFAGYLSARLSADPAFRYSVYFDLYAYSNFYLAAQDSVMAKSLSSQLQPGIKDDYRKLREFVQSHRNPVERLIDKLYGQYLKANEQPGGRLSYNEVIGWLVAYYKKFGKDAI